MDFLFILNNVNISSLWMLGKAKLLIFAMLQITLILLLKKISISTLKLMLLNLKLGPNICILFKK